MQLGARLAALAVVLYVLATVLALFGGLKGTPVGTRADGGQRASYTPPPELLPEGLNLTQLVLEDRCFGLSCYECSEIGTTGLGKQQCGWVSAGSGFVHADGNQVDAGLIRTPGFCIAGATTSDQECDAVEEFCALNGAAFAGCHYRSKCFNRPCHECINMEGCAWRKLSMLFAASTVPDPILGHCAPSTAAPPLFGEAAENAEAECAVVEEFCQIERWRQTEFCQPYTTVEEQAVADCGCAELICDADNDGANDFPCYCGQNDCTSKCCCTQEAMRDSESGGCISRFEPWHESLVDHDCYRDWTNACSDGAMAAVWAERRVRLPAMLAQGLLSASADASLLAAVVTLLDSRVDRFAMLSSFAAGLGLPVFEFLMTAGIDQTALELDAELKLPNRPRKALELSYLLTRAEGLTFFKLDTFFLAVAHFLHAVDCRDLRMQRAHVPDEGRWLIVHQFLSAALGTSALIATVLSPSGVGKAGSTAAAARAIATGLLVAPWAFVVHKRLVINEAAAEAADLQLHPVRDNTNDSSLDAVCPPASNPVEQYADADDDGPQLIGATRAPDRSVREERTETDEGDSSRESVDITDFCDGDNFDPRAMTTAGTSTVSEAPTTELGDSTPTDEHEVPVQPAGTL